VLREIFSLMLGDGSWTDYRHQAVQENRCDTNESCGNVKLLG